MITIDRDVLNDFERVSLLEWLETNGIGGWASSSLSFANTRRYHGLVVSAYPSRPERSVIVSRLDETVGGAFLGCSRFPSLVHPRGFEYLQSFQKGVFPVWEYDTGHVVLRKTVVAVQGENTTILLYEILKAQKPFPMRFQPFLAGRDYHSLMPRTADPVLPFVNIDIPGSHYTAAPESWHDFQYDRETERGLDDREDLFTPGIYDVTLRKGDVIPVILCADDDDDRDAFELIDRERSRRETLTISSEHFLNDLAAAADQFLIERGGAERTVIAGYHWFTDWGRDTMISLPGLCLATGRFDEAAGILRRWLATTSRGMIPNRFPDGTSEPAFNAVDATLWMFVAVWRYIEQTGDQPLAAEAIPVLRSIVEAFDRGTRFNIHVDDDGLLYAGTTGVALTWMDAVVEGDVITPRRGKPVEVNALWYNALRIMGALTREAAWTSRAEVVKTGFEAAFWNPSKQCCFDVIGPADDSVRPNQLLVLSLPFPMFTDRRGESILNICESKLLTPVGLRTLSPEDPRYRGKLMGTPRERDSAYHQGTIWPWLLGPYADAVLRIRGESGRDQARRALQGMRAHLLEAGVGTISEVFDGDAPHAPRGCIAQAWSVAEVLRIAALLEEPSDATGASTANESVSGE